MRHTRCDGMAMTTPRDDIAGLIERLRDALVDEPNYGKCLRMSLQPEDVEAAATQLAALSARVKELEEERDDALDQVEELERSAEVVSDEFEKDCWKAMRSLLSECKFDWRNVEPDGVTADEAREYIHDTLNDLESRALRAEQERVTEWNLRREAESQRDVAKAAADTLRQERDGLEAQLPDGMKHCTITFHECEKGHGKLSATNWIDSGCPWCQRNEAYERSAKVADSAADIWNADGCLLEYTSVTIAAECEGIAAAIRRLASGPEKEKKE